MTFNTSEYIQYLEDWQILIYLYENYRYYLIPNEINHHFQRHHNDIYDLHTRQEIKRYATTLTLYEPSNIVIPTNMPPSIPGLKI